MIAYRSPRLCVHLKCLEVKIEESRYASEFVNMFVIITTDFVSFVTLSNDSSNTKSVASVER